MAPWKPCMHMGNGGRIERLQQMKVDDAETEEKEKIKSPSAIVEIEVTAWILNVMRPVKFQIAHIV